MKARDIMTIGAECALESESVESAAKKLADLDVGALPICGDDDRLKGMLTDRDIVVKVVARGLSAAATRVRELAQGKPVTIGADDSIRELVKTMESHQVRRLPVIDGHRLVGIVSQADLARHIGNKQVGELIEAVSARRGALGGGIRRMGRFAVIGGALGGGVGYAFMRMRGGSAGTIRQSTEVSVPLRTAYDQWTQFEEFPLFMEGVERVQQLDDTRLHWVAAVGGKRREWDARIVEQVPDQRVSWQSIGGKPNGGTVTFQPLGATRTKVSVQMDYQPEGMAETLGSALGLAERRVRGDLERFKEMLERRGSASGAWRGEVHAGATQP